MEIDESAKTDDEKEKAVKSPSPPKRKRGRPSKPFNELGKTQTRSKLDAAFKLCTELSQQLGISMNEVLGNIGKRHYFGSNYNKDYGLMYDRISKNENPFADNRMSADRGLFLKETCDMNRGKWDEFRNSCASNELPSNYAMDNLKKELLPNHSELAAGVKYGLGECLSKTVKRCLESVDFNPDAKDTPVSLIADIVTGFDGSGGHHQFQGEGIETKTRNVIYGRYFQSCFTSI